MGVAGDHERDCFARWKGQQIVGVVWRVAQQDDGLMRHIADGSGDGRVGIGIAGHGIVEPGKPESAAGVFDGQVCVVEYGDAVRGERRNHVFASHHYVVIAENGITAWTLEIVEEFGALPCCADGESRWQKLVGHIIAGQKHCIGIQTVDVVDGIASKNGSVNSSRWMSLSCATRKPSNAAGSPGT